MHRFYLADFEEPVLSEPESHHAIHVLRVKPGDIINVFDGRGHEARCQIVEAGKQRVRLQILECLSTQPLHCAVTLAQAIPKKRMDLIVEKATELGVWSIVPLISERTIKRPAGSPKRWREIVLEACKQCGNNYLPHIQPPQTFARFLNAPGSFDLKLIASLQPDAKPLKQILADTLTLRRFNPSTLLLLVGPEGDFTPAEIAAAKSAGCQSLSLGPLVLRSETAALYALSILHYELQTG
jgi:16S rRNA (uracil1498-N3)-methyltransferase